MRALAGTFDQSFKEEVKSRNDIVDVISEYVTLRRTGKNYQGRCPFHQEKTPSFTVSQDKQIFYCFGCHASGDVVSFVMKRENKNFYEALKSLAERAGLDMPERELPPAEAARLRKRQALYDCVARAQEFYAKAFKEPRGSHALEYMLKRGLDMATLERFGIGYAPDSWDDLANHLAAFGIDEESLVQSGLCIRRPKGPGVYDRFRNRVTFPIKDVRGRVIAFGARCLDGQEPKYINSPETEIFGKGKGLFALNIAREPARVLGSIVVVEGYMDTISAHQAGVQNVVASLGTALTQEQAKQLVQICPNVIIAYDSDASGKAAARRGLDTLKEAGANVRVCAMPEGKDPDDFIRQNGGEAFRELLKKAKTVVEYYFDEYQREFGDTMAGRLRAVEAIVPLLSAVDSVVEQATYIRMIAGRTGIEESALRQQIAKALRASASGVSRHKNDQSRNTNTDAQQMEASASRGTPAELEAERSILSLMILDKDCQQRGLRQLKQELFSGAGAIVFEALKDSAFDEGVDIEALIERVGTDLSQQITEMAMREVPEDQAERLKILRDCSIVLKKRRLRRLYAQIQSLETGTEGFQRVFGEYQVLLREIHAQTPR